ncbi:unnamed protein product, partial [Rotaria sp. Silwood1]
LVDLIDDTEETALGSDNTNVNVGEKHSVFTLFSDELSCIIKGNCYCHIHHNSVKHANNSLSIDIEQILLMKNLELQRSYTTAVDLFNIITSVRTKLQERIDSEFFGAACRY